MIRRQKNMSAELRSFRGPLESFYKDILKFVCKFNSLCLYLKHEDKPNANYSNENYFI